MEVLQNEWKAYGRSKIAPLYRAYEIKRLKEKLEMLTEASDDTAEQKKDLEKEITRLESETLEECTQRKKEEDRKKEEAGTVTKAERDRKRAEKEVDEEAQRAAKIAKRDRKRAEKEAEEETQRTAKAAAKTAKRDAKWTADVDAAIVSMIADGVSCSKIASKLGNGLSEDDIRNRWTRYLKESSGIIKPPVQVGRHSSITWTADVDAAIVRMRTDGVSYSKIASKLGDGLTKMDIYNRWTRHLKD